MLQKVLLSLVMMHCCTAAAADENPRCVGMFQGNRYYRASEMPVNYHWACFRFENGKAILVSCSDQAYGQQQLAEYNNKNPLKSQLVESSPTQGQHAETKSVMTPHRAMKPVVVAPVLQLPTVEMPVKQPVSEIAPSPPSLEDGPALALPQ